MNHGPIDRGRLKKSRGDTIRKDLALNDLSLDMIYDRILWHLLIHVVDST